MTFYLEILSAHCSYNKIGLQCNRCMSVRKLREHLTLLVMRMPHTPMRNAA